MIQIQIIVRLMIMIIEIKIKFDVFFCHLKFFIIKYILNVNLF